MTSNNGDPAFPRPDSVWTNPNTGQQSGTPGHPGMTLLEYYTAAALIGMGTWMPDGPNADLNHPIALENRAKWAIQQAEAVIAELDRRAKKEGALKSLPNALLVCVDEEGISLEVEGQWIATYSNDDPEGVALLKLEARLRDIRETGHE